MSETEQGTPDLERLRRRDAGAFTWLVNEHRALVLSLGRSLGLSGADLDDAAAEAFAAVYGALPGFEGRSQLRTWVYRIAHRTMVKHRRGLKRKRLGALPEEMADPGGPSPAAEAAASEEQRRIWAAVDRLGQREAAAIELHYQRGWSVEEIADAMECPTGTVKTLLFRGRERLRELLSDMERSHDRA